MIIKSVTVTPNLVTFSTAEMTGTTNPHQRITIKRGKDVAIILAKNLRLRDEILKFGGEQRRPFVDNNL